MHGYAAKERVVRFQNHVRVGYDDNIYSTEDKQGSGYVTDIINLSTKTTFSSRTDAMLYWQPEFRYRFDAEPNDIMYQDLYARFNHAISQRAFISLWDRFRYQDKEGQTGPGVSVIDQRFIENDLNGSLDYTLTSLSSLRVGAGYEMRVWNDDAYGKGTANNDYDQLRGDGSFNYQLVENRTQLMGGLNYVDHQYEGSRGGFESITALVGIDQNFNPDVTGYARVGGTLSDVEYYGSTEDSTTPYLQAGLQVNPTARTSINGSLGYSIYRSENSIYNAQDRFDLTIGVRQDITAKINLAASLSYFLGFYDSAYGSVGIADATDNYAMLSLRGSYQLNRNNFLEAGYTFRNRWTSGALYEYDGNIVDIGWRLRL